MVAWETVLVGGNVNANVNSYVHQNTKKCLLVYYYIVKITYFLFRYTFLKFL